MKQPMAFAGLLAACALLLCVLLIAQPAREQVSLKSVDLRRSSHASVRHSRPASPYLKTAEFMLQQRTDTTASATNSRATSWLLLSQPTWAEKLLWMAPGAFRLTMPSTVRTNIRRRCMTCLASGHSR